MALGQFYRENGGIVYYLLVMPLVLLPLSKPRAIAAAAAGPASLTTLFGVVSFCWQIMRGDTQAAVQILLLSWGFIWASSSAAKIRFDDFYRLYAFAVVVGICVWLFGDLNQWGVLPFTTKFAGEAEWRVSFFPNIAYTAFFSLALILVAFRDPAPKGKLWYFVVSLAAYFLLFSFVRTAFICLIMYAALKWLFRRKRSIGTLFWVPLILVVSINLFIAFSPPFLSHIQNVGFFSRLFLRGEHGLTEYEIWQQLYRPYVWGEHFKQFWSSPFLMGWGSVDFNQIKSVALVLGQNQGGLISLPTRLLAQYGFPAFLFFIFAIWRLYILAARGDAWGCACFPIVVMAMLHWGTMFHPTDAMFGIYVMILSRGSRSLAVSAPARTTQRRIQRPLRPRNYGRLPNGAPK